MVPRPPGSARPDSVAGGPASPRGAAPATPGDQLRWGACLAGLSRVEEAISHELRSRWHGLGLHAGLLAQIGRGGDSGGADVTARLARYAGVMNDELSLLRETTEALLRQLRVADEATELPGDLGAMLRELTPLLSPHARMQRVGWAPSIREGPVRVDGNPAALRQALFLLLLEAIERVGPGDELETRLAATPAGSLLVVTDPGGTLASRLTLAMGADAAPAADADMGLRAVGAVLEATSARVATAGAVLEVRWPVAGNAG